MPRPAIGTYPVARWGGINTYAYVRNNPVNWIDPDGRLAQVLIPGAAVGSGVAAIICAANPQLCKKAVQGCIDALEKMLSEADDKHPSTPTGQRGNELKVKPGTNRPTTIGDRDFTGHALDRMQGRGVPPSAVEDAIQNGQSSPGRNPGTTDHVGDNGVTVVTGENGQVITVIPK